MANTQSEAKRPLSVSAAGCNRLPALWRSVTAQAKGGGAFSSRKERQRNTRQKSLFIPVLPASKAAANSVISRWMRSDPDVTVPAA